MAIRILQQRKATQTRLPFSFKIHSFNSVIVKIRCQSTHCVYYVIGQEMYWTLALLDSLKAQRLLAFPSVIISVQRGEKIANTSNLNIKKMRKL